jgi:hypothetical protein
VNWVRLQALHRVIYDLLPYDVVMEFSLMYYQSHSALGSKNLENVNFRKNDQAFF